MTLGTDLADTHRRSDAPGSRRARRARRAPIGRGPATVPTGGVRAGSPVGARPVRSRRVRRRPPGGDSRREHGRRGFPRVREPGRTDRPALRALRRPAPTRRGRLAHTAVRADRGRRPLVRPWHRGLQGQHPHAPHRPTGPGCRCARQPQARRRGFGGAGHRRPRGLRPAGPRPAAGRHDPRVRHRERRRRHARGHDQPPRDGQRRRQRRGPRLRAALRHVRRRCP